MSHPVPDLTCADVESVLQQLGYVEPDLDTALPSGGRERLCALLTVLLAVVEAHIRARDCFLEEEYFAVTDHLAEETCPCSFGQHVA